MSSIPCETFEAARLDVLHHESLTETYIYTFSVRLAAAASGPRRPELKLSLRAYPMEKSDKGHWEQLDAGDKLILPPAAFQEAARIRLPMSKGVVLRV